jgi:phosphate-selective porin OprO/OprP
MKKLSLIIALALSTTLLSSSASAAADDVMARIQQLEQEIQILKRQAEIDKEEAGKKAEKTPAVDFGKKGLSITSADKNFQISLRGYVQADGRLFIDDKQSAETDNLLLRRVRPIIEGTVFSTYSYRIMPDFAGSTPRLFDGYVDANFLPEFKVRVGKFKTPIGLERLQSGSELLFVERSLATNLVPNRDIGAEIFGDLFHNTLNYSLGIFNGTADLGNSDTDTDDNKDIAGRLFARPFINSDVLRLQNLGFGIAGSYGKRSGSATSTMLGNYLTPGQATFFTYRTGTAATDTAFASGEHSRISPQAYFYTGPFGALGEYVISSQQVKRSTNTTTLDNRAWNVELSYVLTGEDASFNGVNVDKPLDAAHGTWGAVELAGRYNAISLDRDAFPLYADITRSARNASAWAGGVNWYLNDNVKVNLDYEYTSFDGGSAAGSDRPAEKLVISRVQYKF